MSTASREVVRIVLPRAGKSEKIVIKNDKGRLSEEEIERMVKEAEDFAEQVQPAMRCRLPTGDIT